jgi:hypothetical protein
VTDSPAKVSTFSVPEIVGHVPLTVGRFGGVLPPPLLPLDPDEPELPPASGIPPELPLLPELPELPELPLAPEDPLEPDDPLDPLDPLEPLDPLDPPDPLLELPPDDPEREVDPPPELPEDPPGSPSVGDDVPQAAVPKPLPATSATAPRTPHPRANRIIVRPPSSTRDSEARGRWSDK